VIDPEKLLALELPPVEQSYDERDTMLYALGVGLGIDPLDAAQLRFVTEDRLLALPTMAVVLGYPRGWWSDGRTGIDALRVVHASERIALHAALPPAGRVRAHTRVVGVTDKGAEKGALVAMEREIFDAASGRRLATVGHVAFCRGDGGGGSAGQPLDPPHAVPGRPADISVTLPTQPQTALIYRLSGDRNRLHSDPATARRAGFPGPILHGLATYGVIGHALLRTLCGDDPARLSGMECRFTAPVLPGDAIRTEIWRDGAAASFRAFVGERVVADNGAARIGGG
jgi:acyl dehydratase